MAVEGSKGVGSKVSSLTKSLLGGGDWVGDGVALRPMMLSQMVILQLAAGYDSDRPERLKSALRDSGRRLECYNEAGDWRVEAEKEHAVHNAWRF